MFPKQLGACFKAAAVACYLPPVPPYTPPPCTADSVTAPQLDIDGSDIEMMAGEAMKQHHLLRNNPVEVGIDEVRDRTPLPPCP